MGKKNSIVVGLTSARPRSVLVIGEMTENGVEIIGVGFILARARGW